MSDVPRSLQSRVSTIQTVVLTADVFQLFIKGKRQKAIYRLVTAPQGGTQKYTLAFAYDSPR